MRRLLVAALLLFVIVVLFRVLFGAPLVRRVMESFVGSSGPSSLLNISTECPSGSQMYIYDGVVYCCNGTVNPDADTVERSCRPLLFGGPPQKIFCTLGPTRGSIPNCLELRAGLLQAEGEKYCPPSKPNFCSGPTGGRCCASATNSAGTDCVDTTPGSFCDVKSGLKSELADTTMTSCQFQKAAETAPACPDGYHKFTSVGGGPLAGAAVYGCTDMTSTCYSQAVIQGLKEMGYPTDNFKVCDSQ
jgi:hypothetical protein